MARSWSAPAPASSSGASAAFDASRDADRDLDADGVSEQASVLGGDHRNLTERWFRSHGASGEDIGELAEEPRSLLRD